MTKTAEAPIKWQHIGVRRSLSSNNPAKNYLRQLLILAKPQFVRTEASAAEVADRDIRAFLSARIYDHSILLSSSNGYVPIRRELMK